MLSKDIKIIDKEFIEEGFSSNGVWVAWSRIKTALAELAATDAQHTQPAICAHLKVNRLCYAWGHRGKKVCACCEKARKQQASA